MAEYIKLEDAKKVLRLRLFEENYSERQVDIFINDISKIQAADVRENVHGKWIYKEDENVFICSKCGGAMVRNTYFYCPWCGASMQTEKKAERS